jgi:hypothetical protein
VGVTAAAVEIRQALPAEPVLCFLLFQPCSYTSGEKYRNTTEKFLKSNIFNITVQLKFQIIAQHGLI